MEGKKSFILYLDYKKQFDLLTDEQVGRLIRALMQYAESGEIGDFPDDGMLAMCFSFISSAMDRDSAKYQEACDKNRANIKKRWDKKKEAEKPEKESDTTVYDRIPNDTKNTTVYDRIRPDTTVSSGIPENTKRTDNDNDSDSDNDNDSDNDTKNNNGRYAPDFERFWHVYPRKIGKGECYKEYQARLKDGFSPDELYQAAFEYSCQCKESRTESKYIKHGKTFLSDNLPFMDYLPRGHLDGQQPIKERDPTQNPFAQFKEDENADN